MQTDRVEYIQSANLMLFPLSCQNKIMLSVVQKLSSVRSEKPFEVVTVFSLCSKLVLNRL